MSVGASVGNELGRSVGRPEGAALGMAVGPALGNAVGCPVVGGVLPVPDDPAGAVGEAMADKHTSVFFLPPGRAPQRPDPHSAAVLHVAPTLLVGRGVGSLVGFRVVGDFVDSTLPADSTASTATATATSTARTADADTIVSLVCSEPAG